MVLHKIMAQFVTFPLLNNTPRKKDFLKDFESRIVLRDLIAVKYACLLSENWSTLQILISVLLPIL